jgi:pheromone a factor receptor
VYLKFFYHKAWNTGTCLYMLWAGLGCFVMGVDAILFNGNAYNHWQIWCDICELHLHELRRLSQRLPSHQNYYSCQRWRSSGSALHYAQAVQDCIGTICYDHQTRETASRHDRSLDWPRYSINSAAHVYVVSPSALYPLDLKNSADYINQGHRYDIFEDIGCLPHVYNTWVTILTIWTWPIIIGMVSAVYCCNLVPRGHGLCVILTGLEGLSIRAFARRHAQFKQYLSANNNLSANRYFRLMALGSCDLLLTIPFATWTLYNNVALDDLYPWYSWANTHSHFGRVLQYPRLIWAENHRLVIAFEATRWSVVVCAFLFFAFFGFADEARKHYRLAFNSVAKRMGYSSAFTSSASSSSTGFVIHCLPKFP